MSSTLDDIVPVSMHLQLIGKVALVTSAVAALTLLIVIFFVGADGGNSYLEALQSHSISQSNLGVVMLIMGLFLIGFVAVVTWVVTLYASFRVAGPLFRFCRDLELSPIADRPIGIRKDDYLQEVSQELLDTVATLRSHYKEVEAVTSQLSDAYQDSNKKKIAELLVTINELEGQVHVD
ncbi:MAG: hypothetical protein L3J28_02110 [Candidatus Polarisedimenticolaceae bacterium]|nr:hypothetical protein [Candidatus Polarisedimenticolaceae bacterium]